MGFLALLVPITALMIPIVAILVKSSIGKAIARRIEEGGHHHSSLPASLSQEERNTIKMLEAEVQSLRKNVETLNEEVWIIKNEYQFLETLLQTNDTDKKQRAD